MYYAGIDVGTSGCKVMVVSPDGEIIALARREYGLIHPRPGWMELDAELVMRSVTDCLGEVCSDGVGRRIAAVAVSTQGEAIIPVDADWRALDYAIVTFDIRNDEEYREFAESVNTREVTRKTGAPVHPMFSLLKMMWMQKKNPSVYAAAKKILCFGDFVACRMGAEPRIDYTMAARTMAFDITALRWSECLLETARIGRDMLPDAIPSGSVIGSVSAGFSEATGLAQGAKIVAGAHDQACCALGAGVVAAGTAMDSLGTTESILCVQPSYTPNDQIAKGNIACYPYILSGRYAYLSFLSCCGSVLKWYTEAILGGGQSFEELDMQAAKTDRPTGLFLLPHFAGSGTPYLDFTSTGVISGLTLGTSMEDIYTAIMEGTAYEMRQNLSIMEDCGVSTSHIRCIGGGSKSDLWMQIKSDITGIPLTSMRVTEAGCYGAAMLACAGDTGADAALLASLWAREIRTYEPQHDMKQKYDELFRKYTGLYRISLEMRER